MSKKEKKKIYYPSDEDLNSARICWDNNIAFCMKRYDPESELYYIEKYDCSKPLIRGLYLRKDVSKPYSFTNRLMLNEYDSWVKVFELYRIYAKSIVKVSDKDVCTEIRVTHDLQKPSIAKQNNKKPKMKEEKLSNNQIDLLDMIAEVEKEQSDQNLT